MGGDRQGPSAVSCGVARQRHTLTSTSLWSPSPPTQAAKLQPPPAPPRCNYVTDPLCAPRPDLTIGPEEHGLVATRCVPRSAPCILGSMIESSRVNQMSISSSDVKFHSSRGRRVLRSSKDTSSRPPRQRARLPVSEPRNFFLPILHVSSWKNP